VVRCLASCPPVWVWLAYTFWAQASLPNQSTLQKDLCEVRLLVPGCCCWTLCLATALASAKTEAVIRLGRCLAHAKAAKENWQMPGLCLGSKK